MAEPLTQYYMTQTTTARRSFAQLQVKTVVRAEGTPAAVTNLTGCQGSATSARPDGSALGAIAAPDAATGTRSNPFVVHADGTVKYEGTSTPVLKNHSWSVAIFGINVKTGGSPNAVGTKQSSGTVKVSDYLAFRVTGLYHVSGKIVGDGNARCDGDGWVKLEGNPIGSPLWIVGVVFSVGGLALLFFGLPTARLAGAAAAGAGAGAVIAGPVEQKKTTYKAVCDHSDHRLQGGWFGDDRNTYAEARADANAHNQANPGHKAGVL